MTIRLVDTRWHKELTDALHADANELKIICPFIKSGSLDRLLSKRSRSIRVITRFNLADFSEGVSDIAALRKLLDAGALVKRSLSESDICDLFISPAIRRAGWNPITQISA